MANTQHPEILKKASVINPLAIVLILSFALSGSIGPNDSDKKTFLITFEGDGDAEAFGDVGPEVVDVLVGPQSHGIYCGLGPAPILCPPHQCNDGIDNDSDGDIDYPADPGCSSSSDDSEQNPACSDGYDNDADGYVDSNDPGCTSVRDSSECNYWTSSVNFVQTDRDGGGWGTSTEIYSFDFKYNGPNCSGDPYFTGSWAYGCTYRSADWDLVSCNVSTTPTSRESIGTFKCISSNCAGLTSPYTMTAKVTIKDDGSFTCGFNPAFGSYVSTTCS